MIRPFRILTVDDQPRVRSGMRALLASRFDIAEIYEAADGAEAVRRVQELKPEVVLMDILMPEMDGLESTRLIKALQPHVHVIALSMYTEYREAALAAGADGFVSKAEAAERLLDTIAEVTRSNRTAAD